jgi:hypothetical protein
LARLQVSAQLPFPSQPLKIAFAYNTTIPELDAEGSSLSFTYGGDWP